MKIDFSPNFYRQYKKANVKIRKSVDKKIAIFIKNPYDSSLNNHLLHEPYQEYRSIDITADYRALYEEVHLGTEELAYFVRIGTHDQLYGKFGKN